MRSSDWSSDVCSSDLLPIKQGAGHALFERGVAGLPGILDRQAMIENEACHQHPAGVAVSLVDLSHLPSHPRRGSDMIEEAGRAPRIGFVVGRAGYASGEGDATGDAFPDPANRGFRPPRRAIEPGPGY